MQGIGQALCEQVVYDRETGQPLTAQLHGLRDAARRRCASDFKTEFDTTIPCMTNPLGVKGVGERSAPSARRRRSSTR